jgi:hypothetical protein
VSRSTWAAGALAVATVLQPAIARTQPVLVDSFESIDAWHASPADGVTLTITFDSGRTGRCARLDYDFRGHAGWAAAHRTSPVELPAHWELSLWLRGTPAVQTLEVKLLDPTGENVWWSVLRDLEIGDAWQHIVVKKRHLRFAWGPAGGGDLTQLGAIELALVPGEGGASTVWLDDLALSAVPPPRPATGSPHITASSSASGLVPAVAVDARPSTCWRSAGDSLGEQWLALDYGGLVELGGLIIDWDRAAAPARFAVQTSADGTAWSTRWQVASTHGARSWVPLPDTDCRLVRLLLEAPPGAAVGICELEVQGLDFAATANDFMGAVARGARRGLYPRGLLGEMTAWTVVGPSSGKGRRGLLGADGSFEPLPRSASLEPFVMLDGSLVTWADVTRKHSLLDGRLPIPTVTWHTPRFDLEVTAVAEDDRSTLLYRLESRSAAVIEPQLAIALRPFQVNPPSQHLNGPGGVAVMSTVSCTTSGMTLAGSWTALAEPAADRCGAVGFDSGDVVALLSSGELPSATHADPPYPSAALVWDLRLEPGATREVALTIRFGPPGTSSPAAEPVADLVARVAGQWRELLSRVEITVPPSARDVIDTLAANLGFMLVNRDGPALQPGARAYARSWIRDGAMMAAALLRLGHDDAVKNFARWFARYQYDDGKAPCCVDHRGADPVPENDSDGELIFLVAETVRMTRDLAFAEELWPHVDRAAAHIDTLRLQCRTAACATPDTRAFFGLVPESISHEGYSARPMHSYWDDYWALRGLTDAAELASALGHHARAAELLASSAEMRANLLASLELAMQGHGIDYLPGCAELGDFDPTSTTVAIAPAAIDAVLPRDAVLATFDNHWRSFCARRDGDVLWESYTPYELRTVGVFVRLGWRDRAWHLLETFLKDRMPAGWRQWPEIVWRDRTTARFLGDLPHTWVGSDFARSVLDIFAWERETDQALVVAAGVPRAWLDEGAVGVRNLHTRWGLLTYTLEKSEDTLRFRLDPGLDLPPGGVALSLPVETPPAAVRVNGRLIEPDHHGEIALHEIPAEVEIQGPWPADHNPRSTP